MKYHADMPFTLASSSSSTRSTFYSSRKVSVSKEMRIEIPQDVVSMASLSSRSVTNISSEKTVTWTTSTKKSHKKREPPQARITYNTHPSTADVRSSILDATDPLISKKTRSYKKQPPIKEFVPPSNEKSRRKSKIRVPLTVEDIETSSGADSAGYRTPPKRRSRKSKDKKSKDRKSKDRKSKDRKSKDRRSKERKSKEKKSRSTVRSNKLLYEAENILRELEEADKIRQLEIDSRSASSKRNAENEPTPEQDKSSRNYAHEDQQCTEMNVECSVQKGSRKKKSTRSRVTGKSCTDSLYSDTTRTNTRYTNNSYGCGSDQTSTVVETLTDITTLDRSSTAVTYTDKIRVDQSYINKRLLDKNYTLKEYRDETYLNQLYKEKMRRERLDNNHKQPETIEEEEEEITDETTIVTTVEVKGCGKIPTLTDPISDLKHREELHKLALQLPYEDMPCLRGRREEKRLKLLGIPQNHGDGPIANQTPAEKKWLANRSRRDIWKLRQMLENINERRKPKRRAASQATTSTDPYTQSPYYSGTKRKSLYAGPYSSTVQDPEKCKVVKEYLRKTKCWEQNKSATMPEKEVKELTEPEPTPTLSRIDLDMMEAYLSEISITMMNKDIYEMHKKQMEKAKRSSQSLPTRHYANRGSKILRALPTSGLPTDGVQFMLEFENLHQEICGKKGKGRNCK